MNKKKTLEEIKKNFDRDLRKKINPLYHISQHVHDDNLVELKELFEAVGNFAYEEAKKEVIEDMKDRVRKFRLKRTGQQEISMMVREVEKRHLLPSNEGAGNYHNPQSHSGIHCKDKNCKVPHFD